MDWLTLGVLCVYLLINAVIGYAVWSRRRRLTNERTEDYYIGGRSLGSVALVFTILASLVSAGSFLGNPGVAYTVGWAWVLQSLAFVPSAIFLLGPLSKKFAIVSRKLGSVTVTDILRHRYDNPFLVVAAAVGMVVFLVAYMVAQFVGGARVIESITGLPYVWGVVIFGVMVAGYTAFGGFKADVITDVFQGLVMLAGSFLLWFAVLSVASWSEVTEEVRRTSPDMMTLPGPGDVTIPFLTSMFIVFGIGSAVLPHIAVRAMSYRETQAMHNAMIWGPMIGYVFGVGFAALGVFAHVLVPNLSSGDLAIPTLILDVLPGWMAGPLLAAPIAAIMSTVDSMILVVSAAIVKDLYHNYVDRAASDERLSKLGAGTSLVIGVVVMVAAFRPPELLTFLVIFAIGGLQVTLFWPVILGLYWKRANATGAVLSIVSGLASFLLLKSYLTAWTLGMDPLVISLVVSGVAFVAGSYATRPPSRSVIAKFWGTNREVQTVLVQEGSLR